MPIRTSLWRFVIPAGLFAGLLTAPVSLDLGQDLWLAVSKAYARGSGGGGAGGSAGGRGGGPGGGGGAQSSTSSSASSTSSSASNTSSATSGNDPGSRSGSDKSTVSVAHGSAQAGGAQGGDAQDGDAQDGQALADARERYDRALATEAHLSTTASAKPGQGLVTSNETVIVDSESGEVIHVFGEEEAQALIRAGWMGPQARSDRAFASHGEKVRTYVAIARALDCSPEVGVLQANFGSGRPAPGPTGDWRYVNLDLNGDGVIDRKDLELARQQEAMR